FSPGEPAAIHPVLARLRSEDRIVCGIVGRLDPDKRPFHLLELAEATRDALPRLAFAFVGTGSMENEIRQAITERNLQERVFLLGWQPSMVDCYRQMDILLHLNETEGFGLIFIEAMASELPVIGADGSAVREIVRPGQDGFICKLGEWSQWLEALRELHDPDLRQQIGKAGRERVCKHFSIAVMCDHYAEVYQRLLA
ncbi:MAG: glycosyltransferase family 4 protein, partial [Planctomycetes bacterium]|nr:glycosyltransferase family 4 protein [Planctomycetota bacterium]